MFTLKLFRRRHNLDGGVMTKIIAVHHVETIEIGPSDARHGARGDGRSTLEVRAFQSSGDYESFFVGQRTPELTAVNDDNHWEWGLLENWEGNTTEHFRPHTYG